MFGTCAALGWAAARSTWLSQEGVATTNLRVAFAVLAERLRENLGAKRPIFLQNPGNAGDALIRFGTRAFFEDLGLEVVDLDMGRRLSKLEALAIAAADASGDRLFIYAGSGAWSRACDLGRRNVQRLARFTDRIVVLPTTFEMFDLPRFRAVFRRDDFESRSVAPRAEFCHDMAFYLALIDPDRVLPDRRPPDLGVGYMFRTDNERRACGFASLAGNLDLSASGDHRSDPRAFLREIDRYAEIVTDRLHVAIGALLLGKPVVLVTGAYFKIETIYRSSILGNFPNVRLVKDDAELASIVNRQG
jgi:hypothetical protein